MGETLRFIKIQCPGVLASDITLELVVNGCVVTIHRRASHGVGASAWTKRFQFSPSDGHFELDTYLSRLELGFLQPVFRMRPSQTYGLIELLSLDSSEKQVQDSGFHPEANISAEPSPEP